MTSIDMRYCVCCKSKTETKRDWHGRFSCAQCGYLFPRDPQLPRERLRHFILKLPVRTEDDYQTLRQHERYAWDINMFVADVENGGLIQYLTNSSGDHALQALHALKAIGAERTYQALRGICNLFPNGQPSPTQDTRVQEMERLPDHNAIDVIAARLRQRPLDEEDVIERLLNYLDEVS